MTAVAARSSRGVALALLSAATFGSSGAVAASLLQAGWSAGAAVFFRLAVAAVALTVPALLALRGRWELLRRRAGAVVVFGVMAVAGCQVCYFNAVQHLSVGVALLLEYLASVLVVGWLWLRHGARPRPLTIGGTALAVLGLVLVLDVTGSTRVDLVGVLWGLAAAVGLVVYFVMSARGEDEVPPVVMAWAGMVVGAVLLGVLALLGLLPFTASGGRVVLLDHRVSALVPVLWLALGAAALAYVAGIGAARLLGPKVASFVGLSEVLFAVLFAWALLHQLPAAVQVAGGVVVVAGIALVRLDELREPPALLETAALPT